MIPKNAIKKVKNDIHLEIAAGSLIAYGVFPQTAEGIRKAKETAASKDTWLAPSDLPEYYANIDDDLLKGRENDAIRAIRKTLKEFYGISSAGTEDYIDTRSSRPAVPAGIQITWFSVTQVGPTTWEKLKAQLTGKGYFSEVNLSEKDADELISNIKKSGEFPSLKDQSGIHNEVYQNWLVDTYLPNYGKTQVYNPGDKFVDDGKEFADKIVTDLDDALEEKSNEIMDDIDAILEADKKKYEDFKKQLNRKVDHPELYEELQHIQPRYMWGQNGLYDLEFKSDIDRAIYFAGKLSTKDTPDKVAVRAWLKDVTGLDVREDYREVKEYRNKILALILQLVKLHPNERDVVVPPVYDGYYQDPEEEEEEEDEEEMDDEEYDDLYGSNLDDLLDSLKDDEGEDPEEIAEEIEEKKQELEEAAEEDEEDFGSEDDIPDELLRDPVEDDEGDIGSEDDIPDELFDDTIDPSILEEIINKRKGKTGTKEKKSYYVSNTKLLQGITKSLAAVTGQLEQVNQSLIEQNQLIQTNIDLNLASLEALQAQDDILTTKFDAILNAFQQQYEASQKAEEDAKRLKAEQNLEDKTTVAGTEDPEDLTKGGKGGGRRNRIQQYFRRRLVRQLYRKLPRQVRSLRTRARKLQRMPGRAVGRIKNATASRMSRMLPPRVSNFGKNIATARSAAKGMGGFSKIKGVGKNIPGLKQALAVWEYGDRKSAGQSDTQAAVGVGGGLAGAAAGAAIGTMLFPGVGTVAGLLIGAAFSAAGAYAGGKIADTITGVEDKQYEQGTPAAKPGMAMLHGTELLIDKDKEANLYGIDTVGATLISATSKFINGLGPAGSAVAPLFEQKAAPLIQLFGAPATTAQTNVGGGFPSIGSIFKKVEKKKEDKTDKEEDFGKDFDDLMKGDSESFAEKLLKMIDPRNIFGNILSLINNRTDAPEFNGDSLVAEGGEAVASGDITSQYGQRWGKMHAGIDIASAKFKQGTPISVIKPGVVKFAGWQDPNNKKAGWGQFVAIQHDDGTASLYGHLDQINVTQGQRIEPDATGKFPVIGKLGNTGSSTGAHLHFEVGTGWTGGTLKGHMDPAPVVGQYLRGGGNVKKKETTGDAPVVKPSGQITGQDITQTFGMEVKDERMFTSGGKQYKAHKTKKGFEFFDGMTRLDTTSKDEKGNVKNAGLVRDFVAQQTQAMYAPPKAESIQMLNKFETGEQEQLILINQQKAPTLPTGFSNIQFEQVGGQWRSTKEYDVKVIEKLRLSLQ